MRLPHLLPLLVVAGACARASTTDAPAAAPIAEVNEASEASEASEESEASEASEANEASEREAAPSTPPRAEEPAPPEPAEVAALRAWAAAHPEDAPAVLYVSRFHLVLLRRSADTTLCVVTDPEDDGPAIDPRCVQIDLASDDLRVLSTRRGSWIAFGGAIFAIGDDGSLKADARPPRGEWRDLHRRVAAPPRRPTVRAPTLAETPADPLPLDALITLSPEELVSNGDAAWSSDSLLCLRVDDVWRCAPAAALGDRYPQVSRVHAPVRGSTGVVVPVELERCDGGSELSECTDELALLAVDGATWSIAASLPLGARVDSRLRDRDDDDAGVRVIGETRSYRRRFAVEAPECVRFTGLDRAAEAYFFHFRDNGPDRSKRRPLPPDRGLAARPAELPRRAPEVDPHVDPADLDGRWRLRGEAWVSVDRCDP